MANEAKARGVEHPAGEDVGHNRLGAFLCWAVVFADIGTSVYYVPGILYGQVGRLAGLFVFLTLIVFLLLTLKYAEVSARFPEGGGVVTVASRAFNPWIGALGGMFILVDYFLTSAISSLSGVQYLSAVIPPIRITGVPPEWLPLAPAIIFTLLLLVGMVFALTRINLRTGNATLVIGIAIGTVLAAAFFVVTTYIMRLGSTTLLSLGIATLLGGFSLGTLGGLGLGRLTARDLSTGERRLSVQGIAIAATSMFAAVAVFAVLILSFIREFLLHLNFTSLFALSILAGMGGLLGTRLGWFRLNNLSNLEKSASVLALGGALGVSIIFGWAFVELITGATLLTLGIVSFLGWLNYRGIKESASISAIAAVAALFSDLLILAIILIRVPHAILGGVFQEMLTGKQLGALTLLTGFSGAFLAFSGLESISQLSPVMRIPRKATVTKALALVFVTVGVTSPLLTLFSTVLLTDPKFRGTMVSPGFANHPSPDAFISQLAGAYGGSLLAILTAVTAAALLIFACNTAIIGAYHVFLALTKLQFFPEILELTSDSRGTPIVAIAVSTIIPIFTLFAVNGRIDTLGNLYAFGLLGAFSLTCISLDIIRFRERHGAAHVGAEIDPELAGSDISVSPTQPELGRASQPRSSWRGVIVTPSARRRVESALRRLATILSKPAADLSYYLGFLTTLLVGIAWLTNLIYKPDATIFGGGLTLLGVGIAVLHYRHQQRRGEPVVFLDTPVFMPGSRLVVLSPTDGQSRHVIQAAVESSSGHPLAFLYLSPQPKNQTSLRMFEIKNRFGADYYARRALSRAKRESTARQLPAKFLYAVGGAKQVFDIARRIRPDEIVAEERTAKRITRALPGDAGMAISPEYVRYQELDGVTVAHNVLPSLYRQRAQPGSGASGQPPAPAKGSVPPSGDRSAPRGQNDEAPPASKPGRSSASNPPGAAPRGAAQPGAQPGNNGHTDKDSSNDSDASRDRSAAPRDWPEP